MPYTVRLRVNKPLTGSSIDTWGELVNANMDRLDESISGMLSFSLSGDKSLTYANDTTDEAHWGILNIIGGAGGRVILQPQQAQFIVRNGSAGNVTFTVDGVVGTIVVPGDVVCVFCDGGNNVYQAGPSGSSTTAYIDAAIAAEHAYATSLSFDAVAGELPAQAGNAGRYMKTNGSNAFWDFVNKADIPGLQTDLDNNKNFAIAAAAIL